MTQEEKQLLFKDLCSRLPYGVICKLSCKLSAKGANISITEKLDTGGLEHFIYGTMDVKPYLHPMSSMTEEEQEDYTSLSNHCISTSTGFVYTEAQILMDWLNAHHFDYRGLYDWLLEHHFDYRGLIEKGLALEAPEDMYKTE